MKRVLVLVLALVAGVFTSCRMAVNGIAASTGPVPERAEVRSHEVPGVPGDRPLTVIVRGWLWDPSSRRVVPPMQAFPLRVNQILEREYGMIADFHDYSWTRLPKDVVSESARFAEWSKVLTEEAKRLGVCVNFMGHSAGAAFVYQAAAQGVPMGYMGTLGLPTFGRAKPPNTLIWANFYTSAHVDDAAGMLWARRMPSDMTIDLMEPHSQFWGAGPVAEVTAEGLASAWKECRPGDAQPV